ncbi:phage tail fiber protein [Microbacterium sp. NPDC055599]
MAFPNATKEAGALAVTGLGNWISLHTSDPGTTGTGEASGGSPAYARKQTTWTGGAADGAVTGSQVSFEVPAGTYTHIGVWTAATAGTFVAGFALSSSTGALPGQTTVNVTPSITVA